MKRVAIGITVLSSGILTILSIFVCASLYLPHLTSWSTAYPSRLFFLIFAGQSKFSNGADGLGLGLFFVLGIILTIVGLAILAIEYFKKEK